MLRSGKIGKTVFVKDIDSGRETPLFSADLQDRNFVWIGRSLMSICDNNELGDLFVNRTPGGDLLVGVSNSPDIRVFSPEGTLLRKFRLQIDPIPVTGAYLETVKAHTMKELRSLPESAFPPDVIKKIGGLSFADFFGSHLPYYREILADAEGNVLVFKTGECLENCPETVQVYSPEGKFLCQTVIDKGDFDFKIDQRFKNIVFAKKALYGLFESKGSDDVSLRLVRMELK